MGTLTERLGKGRGALIEVLRPERRAGQHEIELAAGSNQLGQRAKQVLRTQLEALLETQPVEAHGAAVDLQFEPVAPRREMQGPEPDLGPR